MTGSDMALLLGYRLEDPQGDLFDSILIYLMLNRAQDQVIRYMNSNLYPDLLEVDTGIALSTDTGYPSRLQKYFKAYLLDETKSPTVAGDLSKEPFDGPNGIIAIREASDDFHTKVSFDMVQDHVNGNAEFSTFYPSYFIQGNKVFVYPGSSNVDVWYMRQPTAIASGSTQLENDVLHDLIVDYAEAELWRTNSNYEKYKECIERVSSSMQRMNEKYPSTGVVGVPGPSFQYDPGVLQFGGGLSSTW